MTLNNFIPQIWSAKLLESLKKAHVYTQTGVVNTDYQGDISGKGSVVKINSFGSVAIKPYTKDSDIDAPEALSDAQTSLTIDQAKYFTFSVDDVDAAQQQPKIMSAAMGQARYDLSAVAATYVAEQMYANVATANTIGTDDDAEVLDAAAASDTYDRLIDMSVMLSDAGCPKSGRWGIVPPWFTGQLARDERFSNVSASASPEALRNGIVSRVAGFDVLESLNCPTVTTGGKVNSKIIAGHGMATSFAEQINKVEAYRPEKRFADAVKGLHLYGCKVVRPSCLALLTARGVA